jgi:hypothetical protein
MTNDSLEHYPDIKKSLNSATDKTGEFYFFFVTIESPSGEPNVFKHDAKKLLNIFHNHRPVKNKNIYWLEDEQATKANIVSSLNSFRKTLRKDDHLVVYFSGDTFLYNDSHFFRPSDGVQDNIFSCLPNRYMLDSFRTLACDAVLFCLDAYQVIQAKSGKSAMQKSYTFEPDREPPTLFDDFLSFTLTNNLPCARNSFFIMKDYLNRLAPAQGNSIDFANDRSIASLIKTSYADLIDLYSGNRIEELLVSLLKVVSNNDKYLLSITETLIYKFNQIRSSTHKKGHDEDYQIIKTNAMAVAEAVNTKRFYLVPVPAETQRELPEKKRIKILFTSANPRDEAFLRLDDEAKEVEYELLKSKNRDQFELIKAKGLKITELQDALLNHSPQFVHFAGHGGCDGIALLDDTDKAKLIPNKALGKLFELFSTEVECVFLNSCHSKAQSKEISKHIRKVVCMNNTVPDKMAIRFASSFYKGIASGRDIDFSFKLAKNAIDLEGMNGADIPILLPAK